MYTLSQQIALKFPYAFWHTKVGESDFFGHVSATKESRGLFPMFYDIAPKVGFTGV